MMTTDELTTERGKTHGSFLVNADYAQRLRAFWRDSAQWDRMLPEHREALDMIATKMSRILSGQSQFYDHWADIAGYAKLAEESCKR